MTATLIICSLSALALGGLVWDVFRRALAVQVRRAELAVEERREAEVADVAARVAKLEAGQEVLAAELRSTVAAITLRKVAGR